MGRIRGHVQPIETVVNGLRLDLASLREAFGSRNPSNTDIPPVVWRAIDSTFYSVIKLEMELKIQQRWQNRPEM